MGLPGFEPGSRAPESRKISYNQFREEFRIYLKRYDPESAKKIENYLNRYISNKVIFDPLDVAGLFQGLTKGQAHHLDRALRAFFNFLILKGYPEEWIRLLKKAIPQVQETPDLYVPEEAEVVESLKSVEFINIKYKAIWLLCLESGLRLIEAIKVISGFDEGRLRLVNGFYRYELGIFRGSKQAYFAYFTENSLKLIREVKGLCIKRANASHYYTKFGILAPKYLRKFAFNKMLELGVPESIADFIEGRVPSKIGAKHYAHLIRQADLHYAKYAEYLKSLYSKI